MEYLFKSTACLGALTLFYCLLVKNLTFHKMNRFLLGAVFILTLTLPLVNYDLPFDPTKYVSFDYFKVQDTYTYEDNSFFTEAVITSSSESTINKPTPIEIEESQSYLSQYSIWDYAALVYLIGLTFFLTRFVIQWISLFRFFSSAHKIEGRHSTPFYTSMTEVPPFCFFNRIVIPSSFLTHPELDLILSHEKIHQRNGHTYDIFIAEMVKVIHWFNPFAWLYNRMVKENLEYLTDSHIVKTGHDKQEYQHCLVNTILNMQPVPLTNCFASSLIKKRIVMMNKKQNRKIAAIRYALILIPLFVLTSFFNDGIEQEITSETWEDKIENFEEYHFIVGPKATVEELTQLKEDLAEQLEVKLVFDELKFNDHLEISSLVATFYSGGSKLSINAGNEVKDKGIYPIYFKKTNEEVGVGRLHREPATQILIKEFKKKAEVYLYGITKKDFETLDLENSSSNEVGDVKYKFLIDETPSETIKKQNLFPLNPLHIQEIRESLSTDSDGNKTMTVYINLKSEEKRSLPFNEYPESWKDYKSSVTYNQLNEARIKNFRGQIERLPFPAKYFIDGLPTTSNVLDEYENLEKVEMETYYLSPNINMAPVTQFTEVRVSTKRNKADIEKK
ncbi:M56 family metallopeptidase [Reichenbachiella sp. MALMAid0571]|uniref:M56 family metallopeptidase n=1 Tax=Reichenbachiella sp. MALMAid0571 TaxID=3143939 RepID=UPI0032DF222B